MSKKPNILFCIADDASHFGYNGFGFVKTPNINKLASEGIIFENAFTTNPKCAPSRATILTGKHTWQLEEGCNHCSVFPKNAEVFPDILERNGYFVGFTGKGWAPGDYKKNGRTRNPAGKEYSEIKLSSPSESRISDCDYTSNFERFIKELPEDKPFCFWYGCFEPHRQYNLGESCDFETKEDDISYIPSYWPDNKFVRRDMLDYAYEINWFDKHIGNMVEILRKNVKLDDTLILVTSDNGMPFPRIKGQMYEQDFHLPMIAYWRGSILQSKKLKELISFTDIAPTFLELAGIDYDFMSGQSFLKLLKGQKDSANREYVYFGREKHDVGREGDVGYPVRCIRNNTWLYIRNYEPDRWPSGNPETQYTNCDLSPTKKLIMKMEQDGDASYLNMCFGKRKAEELYNIIDDVECTNNMAYDERYTNVKEKLRRELDKKLEQTNDPRYFGKGEVFENYPIYYPQYNTEVVPHSWQSYLNGTFRPLGPAEGIKTAKCMKDKEI